MASPPQSESSQGLAAPDPAEGPSGTTASAGSRGGESSADKLVPEWGLDGDRQIIVIALVILALIVGVGAWNLAGDDDGSGGAGAETEQTSGGGSDTTRTDALADDAVADDAAAGAAAADDALAPSAAELTGRVESALSEFGAVDASVVTAADGTSTAVLDGFVGTTDDADAAIAATLAVDGIIAVDDRLTVLEPDVEIALAAAGVTDPSVTMDDTAATIAGSVLDTATRDAAIAAARAVPGITTINDKLTIADSDADVDTDAGDTDAGGTDADRDDAGSADAGDGDTTAPDSDADAGTPTEAELQARVDDAIVGLGAAAGDAVGDVDSGQVTLTGTVASDDDREAVVAAVDAIDGVDGVIDRLVVVDDVARVDEINEVLEANPIRFRSSESEILPESFPTLDRVVEVLQGPPLAVRIEGYTDVLGDQDFNLALSQARADAVLVYLTDSGVDTSQMEAVGLGETERFGAGNTVEALAANRRVLFQLP